jgi:hypothetical protein
MINHALEYATSLSWSVFPVHGIVGGACTCGDPTCKRPGKHPCTAHGFLDASTDPKAIRAWWKATPDANIGIATGASGLLVVDIDRHGDLDEGGEAWADIVRTHGAVETAEAVSGSGGRHVYFRLPQGVEVASGQGVLGPSIDVRSARGYIIAPPSNHLIQAYYWDLDPTDGYLIAEAPEWLIALCSRPVVHDEASADAMLPARKVREIRSALAYIDPDPRQVWLEVGMALHSTGAGQQAYGLWAEWSQGSEKFNPADQRRTWKSFRAGGITLSTLFGHAKRAGWVDLDAPVVATVPIAAAPVRDLAGAIPPGFVADLAAWMTRTAPRPQPKLSCAAALCTASVLLGRLVQGDTGLRTNLYIVALAPTGAGKEHPRKAAKDLLATAGLHQDLLGGEGLTSGQAALTRLAKCPASLFLIDEFGLLLGSCKDVACGGRIRELMATLIKVFSSSSTILLGTEYADQKHRPRIDVEYPCASILATSTPDTFYGALSSEYIVSGFLNRFLVVESTDHPPLRVVAPEDPPAALLDWIKVARSPNRAAGNLSGTPATPYRIPKAPAAKRIFECFQQTADARTQSEGVGVRDLWARACELADRVATILACSWDPAAPVVHEGHAEWATAYVQASVDALAGAVVERVANTRFGADAKAALRAILAAGAAGIPVTRLGAHELFRGYQPRYRAEILADLEAAGQITKVTTKGCGRGRPSTVWVGAVHLADGVFS